jgi:hypothetical protein
MKGKISVLLAGLSFLMAGCSNPDIKQMKNAIYKQESSFSTVYNIKEKNLTGLIKKEDWEFSTWNYYDKAVLKSVANNSLEVYKNNENSEEIAIVPDVTAQKDNLIFDVRIYIDRTCKEKVKNFILSYGDSMPFKYGKDSKREYFKEKNIKIQEFAKINEDVYAYHLSWKINPKKLDEQSCVITAGYPYQNRYVNALISSSEIFDMIKK